MAAQDSTLRSIRGLFVLGDELSAFESFCPWFWRRIDAAEVKMTALLTFLLTVAFDLSEFTSITSLVRPTRGR
jgi:hypothetical protein